MHRVKSLPPGCSHTFKIPVIHGKADPEPGPVGHTRPDVAEVVVELMKRSPEWNRRLLAEIRKRPVKPWS